MIQRLDESLYLNVWGPGILSSFFLMSEYKTLNNVIKYQEVQTRPLPDNKISSWKNRKQPL